MSVIEEIKQKTDIVEVIGQYTALTKSGKTFRGLCPFHSEKHGSFFVYPDQQSWHCFGACGTGGDIFSFVMKKDGITFGEALRLMAEKCGVPIPQNVLAEKAREKHDRIYLANEAAADYYHQLLLRSVEAQNVRDYLGKRGVNAQSIEDFRIGYSPNAWDDLQKHLEERGFTTAELLEAGLIGEGDNKLKHDRFRHRLIFPIDDIRGRVIGFGGRALTDSEQPKYLNSPQTPLFDKSSNLYGLDLAKEAMRKEQKAVIVEGYMDVILPHQNGFKNIIASMGTAVGENHITILKKLTKNLVLALDPDAAGQEATLRSVGLENSLGAEIRVAILPEGKDPDEIVQEDPKKWRDIIESAVPILDYSFEKAAAGADLKSSHGKTSVVEALMPIVSQIKDVVRQTYYVDKLAALVGQSPRKIEVLLQNNKVARNVKKSTAESVKSTISNPVEEFCLAVILKNPELKDGYTGLLPEYFEGSENREVYNVIRSCQDVSRVKGLLDSSLWEHYDRIMGRQLLTNKIEAKLADAVLRMREEYLKRLARNRADTLAVEEGNQLRELFVTKEQLGEQKRRQK
jgi:DNA primase